MLKQLEHLNLYDSSNIKAIVLSISLFLLFLVYHGFNFFNDSSSIKKSNENYLNLSLQYLTNYLKWIVRTLLSNFTLWGCITIIILLILMIKTLFSSEIHKINKINPNNSEIAQKTIQNDNYNIYLYYIHIITRNILGIILTNPFILIFLLIIPIFLFISTLSYLYIDEDTQEKNSNPHYIIYTFYITLFVGIAFLLYHYFINISVSVRE